MAHLRSTVVALALFLFVPFVAHAALVNINTGDAEALDTLPGIGPVKAQAIIDYRNQNGPFAHIEDIQNVSGIGPATYEDIKGLITVSGAENPDPPDTREPPDDDTRAPSPKAPPQTNAEPPLARARVEAGSDRTVIVGADAVYTAEVYDAEGTLRTDSTVTWSFGDGTSIAGREVSHTYYAQGDYAVVLEASLKGGVRASASFVTSAVPIAVRIDAVSSAGIALQNTETRTLDLSKWQLVSGGQVFVIPANTSILPGKTIMFSSQVTGLSYAPSAQLLFPNGGLAVSGPSPARIALAVKPSPPAPVLSKVQAVETGASVTETTHGTETVQAPAAQASLAAVGAAGEAVSSTTVTAKKSIFASLWTWGITGMLLASAAAFIFI